MHCTILNVAILALLAARASAVTVKVEVGKGGSLRYTPDNIKAAKGDIVEFHFNAMHTVVAGDFKNPCTPVTSGGFYSGALPQGSNSFFSITIQNTDPVFFYCAIDSHCQGGMVGVINQGSDTLSAYRSGAENSGNTVTPNAPFGGTVGDGSSSATSAATSSSKSTSAIPKSQSKTATVATSEASSSASATTAVIATTSGSATPSGTPSASGSVSPTPTTTAQPGAAGHLIGPVASVVCLVLAVGGMLAF